MIMKYRKGGIFKGIEHRAKGIEKKGQGGKGF